MAKRFLLALTLLAFAFPPIASAEMRLLPGRLDIADFIIEIQKGNVPGHRIMRSLGERDSIQTTLAGEDVWRGNELSSTPAALGSHLFIPRPAAAGEQMTIVCEDPLDNSEGTGIQAIELHYLDALGDEQDETVATNGTGLVDTVATDIRFIQEMHATAVGANTAAVDNCRIFRKTDNTRVYSMISQGTNMSMVPHKMVPRGKTLHLRTWVGSEATSNKQVRLRLRADADNDVPPVVMTDVFLLKSVMALNGSSVSLNLGYTIPALTVVKVSAWTQTVNAEVAVHWWGILVDD